MNARLSPDPKHPITLYQVYQDMRLLIEERGYVSGAVYSRDLLVSNEPDLAVYALASLIMHGEVRKEGAEASRAVQFVFKPIMATVKVKSLMEEVRNMMPTMKGLYLEGSAHYLDSGVNIFTQRFDQFMKGTLSEQKH